MSNERPTDGPWHTDATKQFYVFGSGSTEFAGASTGPFVANASSKANAYLIAAAPDLLLALQIAANTLEVVYRDRDPQNIAAKVAAERARAAIAKATGGAK